MPMSVPKADGVEVLVEAPGWDGAALGAVARRAIGAALAYLDLPVAGVEIAVLGCDDARIAALNARFREKAVPTNVLSWPSRSLPRRADGAPPPLPAAPAALGDIAIAHETCAREAAAKGIALGDHAAHLLVHGVLHLLGHDHDRPGDAALMEGREAEILARLSLPDPYRDGEPDLEGATDRTDGR